MPHIYVNLLVETVGSIASDIEDVPTPFVFDPCVVFKEVPGLVKKPRKVLSIRVAAFSGAVPPSGLGGGVVIPVDFLCSSSPMVIEASARPARGLSASEPKGSLCRCSFLCRFPILANRRLPGLFAYRVPHSPGRGCPAVVYQLLGKSPRRSSSGMISTSRQCPSTGLHYLSRS